MRINVYSQELTKEVALVSKTDERGTTHYGVRIFFEGSPRLHNRPDDDDRSAITYWLPNDVASFTPNNLANVFIEAAVIAEAVASIKLVDATTDQANLALRKILAETPMPF